jgi:hypothetical protein
VSILGTDMQEIFDSFFAKIPDVDFTGKETLLFKLLKTSIGYCYKTVPESLEYIYDEVINEGKFTNVLFLDTIELLSLCMTREYYFRELDNYQELNNILVHKRLINYPIYQSSMTLLVKIIRILMKNSICLDKNFIHTKVRCSI